MTAALRVADFTNSLCTIYPLNPIKKYSQTCVQRPASRPGKSGRCSEVVIIQRVKLYNLLIKKFL